MQIQGLVVSEASGTPYLMLQPETGTSSTLLVEIGPSEASALILFQEGVDPLLPLTHDLLVSALERGDMKVQNLEFYDYISQTPQCRLHILHDKRKITPWPIRPSDGLILALRMHFPVYLDTETARKWAQKDNPLTESLEHMIPLEEPHHPTLH